MTSCDRCQYYKIWIWSYIVFFPNTLYLSLLLCSLLMLNTYHIVLIIHYIDFCKEKVWYPGYISEPKFIFFIFHLCSIWNNLLRAKKNAQNHTQTKTVANVLGFQFVYLWEGYVQAEMITPVLWYVNRLPLLRTAPARWFHYLPNTPTPSQPHPPKLPLQH